MPRFLHFWSQNNDADLLCQRLELFNYKPQLESYKVVVEVHTH